MTTAQLLNPVLEARVVPPPATFQPLRLCMISDDFLPAATGVGVHLQCLAQRMAARGHRVAVLTTRRPGEPARGFWRGVHVYRMYSVSMYGFWQALPTPRTLRALLEEEAPDLVHHHYIGYLMLRAHAAARRLGVRQVYTCHMTAEHLTQPWPMRPFRGLIAGSVVRFCNRCDFVIAPSANLVERYVNDGVRVPSAFVSNPVEFDEETPVTLQEKAPGAFTVLYVGRLNEEKNLPYLLRAFAKLVKAAPRAELRIAGRGDKQAELERLAARLSIANSVRFLGFLDRREVAAQFAQSDVFVLPSLVETQGMVAMEAMRFAKPVIVTNRIVSARELVDDGSNGFIVDPDDDGDLAGKLLRLHADPVLRTRMGAAGFAKSAAYSPQAFADRTEAIYRTVCAGTGRP